jgi:hypothetical protein
MHVIIIIMDACSCYLRLHNGCMWHLHCYSMHLVPHHLCNTGNAPLSAAGLRGLSAQASCLQRLWLEIQRHTLPQLPAVLQQLTCLHTLQLVYNAREPAPQQMAQLHGQQPVIAARIVPASTEGTAALVAAVVQLPQLRYLVLAGLAPTLWRVAAAVQLTRLELTQCRVNAGVVGAVAGSLRQLQVLGLAGNAGELLQRHMHSSIDIA